MVHMVHMMYVYIYVCVTAWRFSKNAVESFGAGIYHKKKGNEVFLMIFKILIHEPQENLTNEKLRKKT